MCLRNSCRIQLRMCVLLHKCCYSLMVWFWFSMDVKKRTHEWLLKEYAYYVHHAWYNEYFNNVHQQRQFILAKKIISQGHMLLCTCDYSMICKYMKVFVCINRDIFIHIQIYIHIPWKKNNRTKHIEELKISVILMG